MVLGLNDIIVLKANWLPKSQNIRSIASLLSLGLDSFIFIDDNIAEREEVRSALPEVAVPALPEDPSLYLSVLINSGLFDLAQGTVEDSNRTRLYQENMEREEFKQGFTDLKSYYTSLQMKLIVSAFSPKNNIRAFQLINKTNQFNLTHQRFSESQFLAWQNNKNHFGFCFSLTDKFSDNGIVGVVLTNLNEEQLIIENFLLSCRVIGREVENAIVNFLVQFALKLKASYLIGKFKPGTRNEMVAMEYQKWGFHLLTTNSELETTWELCLENFTSLPHMITVSQEPNRNIINAV